MDQVRRALATDNAMMLCYGVSAILVGPALPSIITAFSLTLPEAGLAAALQNAGGLAGAAVAMLIADRVTRSRAAVTAFLCLSLALIAAGTAQNYLLLLIWLAAGGFAIRVLDVMLNAHAGSVSGAERGKAMNLLHMFFSVGAFLGPLLARLLFNLGGDWSALFRVVGTGYLLLMLAGIRPLRRYVGSELAAGSGGGESVPAGRPGRGSATVLLGMLLFFYAVHQVGVSAWLPHYLESAGADPDWAGAGLSLYWIGIIAGRLTAARLADRTDISLLMTAGAALSAGFTLAGVLLPAAPASALLWACAGCASGATIPLAYAWAYAILPGRIGTVTSFLAVLMLLGRICGPWLIGLVAGVSSLAASMLIPAGALAAVVLLALLVRAVGGAGDPLP